MSAVNEVSGAMETEGIGTVGTDIYEGPERPADKQELVPMNCYFVYGSSAAEPPEAVSGDPAAVLYAPIQVLIRHKVFETGEDLANTLYSILRTATMANTIGCRFDQGYPIPLGVDEQRVYRWVINITLIMLPSSLSTNVYGTAVYGTATYG